MTRLSCILFLAIAYLYPGQGGSYAQVSEIPKGWKKVSVCQLNFVIPKDLKNENVKGIDSCVAEFKSNSMRLAIDYGLYSGAYKNDGTTFDFKEEFTEIDGKKAQLVTFRDFRGGRKFGTGLYVLIYEVPGKMKTSLNMMINVKKAEDLETAKRIFQSLRFDEFKPFTVEP